MIALHGRNYATLGTEADLNAVWVRYHELKAELLAIDAAAKPLGQVCELIAIYRTVSLPKLAPRTRKHQERWLKEIEHDFGTMQYASCATEAVSGAFIRLMHVQRWLSENKHRPVAANHVIRALNQIFVAAKQQGRTEFNPCDGAGYHEERPRKVRPADGMVNDVYGAAREGMQCMMDIAVMCGLRKQDLLLLPLQAITDTGVKITNWKQLERLKSWAREQFELKKREQEALTEQEIEPYIRFYPYDQAPDLKPVIERALALRLKTLHGKRHASMTLFVNRKGQAITETGFNSEWRRLKEKFGIGAHVYHFHDHKRVAKTQAEKIGVEAHKVLGHSDERTTRKHYDGDRQVLRAVPPVRKAE